MQRTQGVAGCRFAAEFVRHPGTLNPGLGLARPESFSGPAPRLPAPPKRFQPFGQSQGRRDMAASTAGIPSYDFLTLGETLLRLSPPGVQRLDQAHSFEVGI